MKAIFINGSPRKNKNTAQMLESAMKGAQEAGAEVEMIHLYSLNYKGCMSCFLCKRKGNTANGLCGFKDELQPVLEKVINANVLVIGSPVYDSYPSGMARAFIERLVFPAVNYNDYSKPLIRKPLQCATIYTMNCSEELMKPLHYDILLGESARVLGIFGNEPQMLCSHETYQFNDYSNFETAVDESQRAEIRTHRFPKDLQTAYNLGKQLVEKATIINK
ncbi:MAG: flavodoxin family protein [Paludibacteraceae bacterium]|nr:flavodoxin family protein [Paludibacteraceae bacterium]